MAESLPSPAALIQRLRRESVTVMPELLNEAADALASSQEALRAAERAHADEIADMMRELESTAELACQQGRDALKEQHRAEAAERARDAKERKIAQLESERELLKMFTRPSWLL